MKRCFLVVGPESAGNRLLAGVLIRAGCHGRASTHQEWDQALPEDETPAVVIRSFPHGGRWPELPGILQTLSDRGYQTTVLVTVRHPVALTESQVARGHARRVEESMDLVRKAYRRIFADLSGHPRLRSFLVPYEAVCEGGGAESLCIALGLSSSDVNHVMVDGIAQPVASRNARRYWPEEGLLCR